MLIMIIAITVAKTVCGANSCSHICAVVGGQDECFCPVGFELASNSTTTCQGKEDGIIVGVKIFDCAYQLTIRY